MKKSVILLLIMITLCFSLISNFVISKNFSKTNFYISSNFEESGKIDSKLIEILDSGEETIKVIVKLKDEVEEKVGILGRTEKVKVSKDEVIKNSNIENKVKNKFIYSNSFSAELTKQEIENLKENERVEGIYYDFPVYALLQNSTEIINATSTWNLKVNNLNLTGQGQTICIIDTGIDYTHDDLGGCLGEGCRVLGGYDFVNDDEDPIDDNGHGTHCAGITSASGGINGTAPNSNLIAIKVLDYEGGGSFSDITAGIEWCVNNASDFNISVISMSLGTEDPYLFDDYCDNEVELEPTRNAINAAVAENISVVVATGNDGYAYVISAPACIYNSTRVTSTTKADDSISLFANTWNVSSMMMLAAPGGDNTYIGAINSTLPTYDVCLTNSTCTAPYPPFSNNYDSLQGTSMATPHVAGAIAIIKQYLAMTNREMTSKQIEDVLNVTGKQIYDSYADRNFSRIDIYSAILSLDEFAPEVNLISPVNNTFTNERNLTFICNTTDLSLKNITFYLWNSTSLINETSLDISSGFYELNLEIKDLEINNYNWNCLACDEVNNCSLSSNNFTLTINEVLVELITPENNNYTNQEILNFNCNSNSENNLINSTLMIWNSSSILIYNETENISGLENSTIFEINFTDKNILEGSYEWNCLVFDEDNISGFASENFTITYDISFPLIQDITITKTYNSATISWDTNELTNSSIELIGKENKSSLEYGLSHSLSFSSLSSSTTYQYNITNCDLAGNCNYTNDSFTTNSASVNSPSGGGSSSITPITYSPSVSELEIGYNKNMNINEKVSFSLGNNKHTLTVKSVGKNYTNITIQSEIMNLILYTGEEKKVDLDNDYYYDFYLKLNSVINNRANLTIKTINEFYGVFEDDINEDTEESNEDIGESGDDVEENTKIVLWKIIFVIILVILLIKFLLLNKFKRNKNLNYKIKIKKK
jgi:subtilisin family serine protease